MVADAQSTFTEQLQQSKSGEGKVTVTQAKEIEQLVNNPTPVTPVTPAKPQQTTTPSEKSDRGKTGLDQKDTDDLTDGIAVPTFLMMGIGAICFMIQGLMICA